MTQEHVTQEVFRTIFKENRWKSPESVSGQGSTLKATKLLRERLPPVLRNLGISTLVDAPCGDTNWIRHMDYVFSEYVGVDVVPELIQQLQERPAPESWRFVNRDIVTDVLQSADAVLCRDCLGHLPFEHALKVVANWKAAKFHYVITTTFPGAQNRDGSLGRWRRLDLQAAPFCFPDPIALVRERDERPGDPNNFKSLGVWRTVDLP